MSRILVLAAIELEVRSLARALGLDPVTTTGWPHFRGGMLEVACVGLRGAHVAARAVACRPPTLVLSAGVCGGLSPALASGDLVVPETVLAPGGERLPTTPLAGLPRAGTLVSVARVVETPAEKARLWIETGALAVDLESAPILAWAAERGVPAAVIRGVSDTAGQAVPAELVAAVGAGGNLRTGHAVRAVLGHPAMLGRALALRRGTAAALASVARALATLTRTVAAKRVR